MCFQNVGSQLCFRFKKKKKILVSIQSNTQSSPSSSPWHDLNSWLSVQKKPLPVYSSSVNMYLRTFCFDSWLSVQKKQFDLLSILHLISIRGLCFSIQTTRPSKETVTYLLFFSYCAFVDFVFRFFVKFPPFSCIFIIHICLSLDFFVRAWLSRHLSRAKQSATESFYPAYLLTKFHLPQD